MKVKVFPNEARKTVTLILSPITIGYVDYLYEKYDDKKYFASGVLTGADYKEDVLPILKQIADALNEVGKDKLPPGVKYDINDLITMEEDDFALFMKNINKEGVWDKQFKINLQSKSKDPQKRFLFLDLQGEDPVPKDDGWKYTYAIEVEIGVGYNEDEFEKYIYHVFHRAVKVGTRDSGFIKNDKAWDGFDFEESDEDVIKDDDLPF